MKTSYQRRRLPLLGALALLSVVPLVRAQTASQASGGTAQGAQSEMSPIVLAQAGTGSSTGQGRSGTSMARDDSYSILPYTRRGYFGINLGKSRYDTACATGYSCDNPDVAGRIYTGGMFNEFLGVEFGYLNMGRADRSGGRVEAQGLNLSAVARAPIGMFSVFAKGGATYGRTKVSADPLANVPTGTLRRWGGSYGAGAGFEFATGSTLVLEWERHEFKYNTAGKRDVDMTSIGYLQRF